GSEGTRSRHRGVWRDLSRRLRGCREVAGFAGRRSGDMQARRRAAGRNRRGGEARRGVLQQPHARQKFRRPVLQQDLGDMPVTTLPGGRKAVVWFLLLAASVLLPLALGSDAFAQVGVARPQAPPPADGIAGWLLVKQAEFYRMLSGTIRAAKT